MADKSKIKVFMSYRREGGIATARSLYNEFRMRGYDMFLDMEGLRACAFNTALIKEIKTSDVMLLILTPGALDRCDDPKDWVRQEVLCALQNGVTVIPVLAEGYQFPKKMPAGMEKLSVQNAIWINYQLYDAFLDKLTDMLEFLIPHYVNEGKYRLVVAIGCTGGKHRSVTLANELYRRMKDQGNYGMTIYHRDINNRSK